MGEPYSDETKYDFSDKEFKGKPSGGRSFLESQKGKPGRQSLPDALSNIYRDIKKSF